MQLRAAREVSGKTQAQVAKEINVSDLTYQRYEYGQRVPDVYTAQMIAKALKTNVENIFPLPNDGK